MLKDKWSWQDGLAPGQKVEAPLILGREAGNCPAPRHTCGEEVRDRRHLTISCSDPYFTDGQTAAQRGEGSHTVTECVPEPRLCGGSALCFLHHPLWTLPQPGESRCPDVLMAGRVGRQLIGAGVRSLTVKKCFVISCVSQGPTRPFSCKSQAALSQGGFSCSGSFLGAGNADKVTISAHAWTQEGWESLGWERLLTASGGWAVRFSLHLRVRMYIFSRSACLPMPEAISSGVRGGRGVE